MATTNPKARAARVHSIPRTHEGAPAKVISPLETLRRSVLACLLWEDQFYEDGVSIAERIANLVAEVPRFEACTLAVEARRDQYLRHVPLWILRAVAKLGYSNLSMHLCEVIRRPDDITEFLAMYWQDGDEPLAKQVKKGLSKAFKKFDEYQLAKWNRTDRKVTLKGALKMLHPKPDNQEQADLWKRLLEETLKTPDTWETNLSDGADKKETFTRLINDHKLGGLAMLRNLRNMEQAGVDPDIVKKGLQENPFKWVLPFRFYVAAKHAPKYELCIEEAMLRILSQQMRLMGKTVIIVDVSGSMYGANVSEKSELDRAEAASALAAIIWELCEDPVIYATAGNDHTRIHLTKEVPARRGFALSDAIYGLSEPLGGGGIFLTPVCRFIADRENHVTRTIVISDEQDCALGGEDSPNHANPPGERAYMINVGSYKNGIAYKGKWTNITGWSENVIRYIQEVERLV